MRCLFCQLNLCDSFHRFVCSNYWVFYWLNTPCLILLDCLILHLLHLNRQSIYLPLSLSLSPSRHPSCLLGKLRNFQNFPFIFVLPRSFAFSLLLLLSLWPFWLKIYAQLNLIASNFNAKLTHSCTHTLAWQYSHYSGWKLNLDLSLKRAQRNVISGAHSTDQHIYSIRT